VSKVHITNSPNGDTYWIDFYGPTLFYNGRVISVSDSVAKAIFHEDYIIYRKPEKKTKKKRKGAKKCR